MISLTAGDEITYQDDHWQVRSVSASSVDLQSFTAATELTVALNVLFADDSFTAPGDSGHVGEQHLLHLMTDSRRRAADFWYEHMYQVRYGVTPAERAAGVTVELTGTVEERLRRKREELADKGVRVSMSTMWRRHRGFNSRGVIGCADLRGLPGHTRARTTDPIVFDVVWEVMRSFTYKSTPSKRQVIELARTEITSRGIAVPARSTMYQIVDSLSRGEHTFGEAATRRSLANSPDRAFGKARQLYPGQQVQLDATPLDAFVLTADGRTERVDLALAIDVATRSICAAILRPRAAKTVDAIELCIGAMRPMQMRPEWDDAMSLARSYLPDQMLAREDLTAHVAARPIIDIRGVLVDRGKIFISKHFLQALESQQIECRICSPYDPTNKPIVERVFGTISEDFVRWIRGYKGRAIVHRGARPEADAVWPLPLLQAMLDEWIVAVYQRRPTSALRHNLAPRISHSPNAMYSALTESMPTTPRVLSRDEWVSLLPSSRRTLQRYGINLHRLVYDSDDLRFHDLRRTKSPGKARGGKWEVRYDPGNLMRIWVRDDEQQQWIECRWVRAQHCPEPFGLDVLKSLLKHVDAQHEIDQQVLAAWQSLCQRLRNGPEAATHTAKPQSQALAAADSATCTYGTAIR